jgi:hypothetical protein
VDVPAMAARLLPSGEDQISQVWAEMTIAGMARYFRKLLEREAVI